MILKILPVLIGLTILIIFAFKKVNIIFLSIISGMVVAGLSGMPVYESLTDLFMPGAANYIQKYFILFFVSVMFGKFMEISGCARAISKGAVKVLRGNFEIIGMMFGTFLLTYCGVSSLVVAFAMYPIAVGICDQTNIPRYMIPGAIAAGAFTLTLPGMPSLSNAVCGEAFGTTPMSGIGLSVFNFVFTAVLSAAYLYWAVCRAPKKGYMSSKSDFTEDENPDEKVNPFVALIPGVVAVLTLNIFNLPVEVAIALGCLVCFVMFFKKIYSELIRIFNECASSAAVSVLFTGCVVGFGSIVSASPGFNTVVEWTESMNMSPYVSFAITISLLCGFSGSGSGGLAIAVDALGSRYLSMGLNPEALHRIAVSAHVTLDSLPHNGAVNTLLSVCKFTHKEAYFPIFVTTALITSISCAITTAVAVLVY